MHLYSFCLKNQIGKKTRLSINYKLTILSIEYGSWLLKNRRECIKYLKLIPRTQKLKQRKIMLKKICKPAILAISLAVSAEAYCYELGPCPGNSGTCPVVTGNSFQSCGNCCYDSSSTVMYCGCTVDGDESPTRCVNSELEVGKCDPSQPITITLEGYLECTYSSQYGEWHLYSFKNA